MTARRILLAVCFLGMVSCARQDEHAIRVVPKDGRDFEASDCDVVTNLVHAVAGRYRLQEGAGVADRESFPRYRGYWSPTSPVHLDVYCSSNLLQVTVTAVQRARGKENPYRGAIAALAGGFKKEFGARVEEEDDWILVNPFPL